MELRRDVVAVVRSMRRTPGASLLIVLTLGLAIGANATVFSLIDRVAMRPLPVDKPDELVPVSAPTLPTRPHAGAMIAVGVRGGRRMGMDYPLAAALADRLRGVFPAATIRRSWRFT